MFIIQSSSDDNTSQDDRRCILGKYELLLTDNNEITTWNGKVVYTKVEKICTRKGDMFFDCNNNQWIFGSLETGVQDDFMIMGENPPLVGESDCPVNVEEWKINLDGRFRPSFQVDDEIEVVCDGDTTPATTTLLTTTTTQGITPSSDPTVQLSESTLVDLMERMQDLLLSKIDDLSMTQKSTQEQIQDLSMKNDNMKEKLEEIEEGIKKGLQAQPVVYENISSNFLDTLAAPDGDSSKKKAKTFVIGDTVDVVPKESYGFIKLNGSNYRKLFPQDGGTDVKVNIDVLGITKIDSKTKLVGLEMVLTSTWEDDRIIFPLGAPQVNESFQFDPAVLK